MTDGCFYGNGMFRVSPLFELKKLLVPFRVEAIFRHKVSKMLLAKGKITRELIAMLSSWHHSGFQVFCGNRIQPNEEKAMENLVHYIIRASFSQERMQYLDQEGKVVYASKDGKSSKIFPCYGSPPCVRIYRTGASKWRGTKDYVPLSETSVQLVIITSIENRKPLKSMID